MVSHRLRNKILSLVDSNGVRLEDPDAIKTEIVDYYKGLLGSSFKASSALDELSHAVTARVPDEWMDFLISPVTVDEIQVALKSIKGDKSPGPDGYNSSFYHQNWETVGPDLKAAISQFFSQVPSTIKDYRRISCCNVPYKCITKILELVKDYHKDQGPARCAMKLDLMKAYDSVAWPFLFDIMTVMGFPAIFINWVKKCVTSAMFSIVINGELVGYFPGQRGLQQGDPISPYLFLLVREGFSSLLHYRISQSRFTYHPRCSTLQLSQGLRPNLQTSFLLEPLITTRLHASDCRALLIRCSRGSIFILPQKVLKVIEGVLRDFFWSGTVLKSTGAKVKWRDVCSPKAKGGLGIRALKDWNKAAMSRHLWAISKKADSLWIRWIHSYVIKGQCLWHMCTPPYSSWTIRKIFKLRSLVQPWIKSVVGDGLETFPWLDNWHPLGPLFSRYGERVVFNLGRSLSSKVASIISNASWNWPKRRNAVTKEIIENTPTALVPNSGQSDSTYSTIDIHALELDRFLLSLDRLKAGWASQHMTGNGLQQSLYKMVLAASLYHIWLERNNRVFQGSQRDALALVSVVKSTRSCLSLWRKVKRSSRNQRLCAIWNNSQAIFSTV
ncbi:uncharacterized protein LOC131329621 [Rhododendron vialii]|uniref:uncharacterized protein LOC131329621 n=1 Tax=Rhododendron vialii TaxID=182163 RepID=UPI00265D8F75|nr:uncharacterized protein LOC131329621 [Rhododendron vialii]